MPDTILDIRDLTVELPPWADRSQAVSDVSLALIAREILCVVGESGSGKSVMARADHGAASGAACARQRGEHTSRGRGLAAGRAGTDARDPLQPHFDDLPGADDGAESGQDDRCADRGGAGAPYPNGHRDARMERIVAMLECGAPFRSAAARPRVPAPDLRRAAPARDDRDGADPGAAGRDRGRADDRARRDHASRHTGADPRDAGIAPHGGPVHHARFRRRGRNCRPRRRHAAGPAGRDRRRATGSERAAPSVHAIADCRHAGPCAARASAGCRCAARPFRERARQDL